MSDFGKDLSAIRLEHSGVSEAAVQESTNPIGC